MSGGVPAGSFTLKDLVTFGGLFAIVISGSVWIGALSQRVASAEEQLRERKDQGERLARLETLMVEVKTGIVQVQTELRSRRPS